MKKLFLGAAIVAAFLIETHVAPTREATGFSSGDKIFCEDGNVFLVTDAPVGNVKVTFDTKGTSKVSDDVVMEVIPWNT